MADTNVNETAFAGRDSGECSDATIEIKIKTLESQVYTLRVNKSMPVPALKEQILTLTKVPIDRQRLICRGKVLKDDQLLSDYHVEDGHTLHLVVRQPLPPSSSSSTAGSSGGNGTNEQQGTDPTTGTAHNRFGQVSHNVVFGTFNLQDQGEGGIPDLNRILSTVLNSIGIGNLAPSNVGASNGPIAMAQGAASEGQNQADGANDVSLSVNQQQPAQAVSNAQSESAPLTFNMPTQPHLRPTSQQMVIPDSLTTLSQYLNRMVHAFSLDGYESQPHSFTASSSTGSQDQTAASGLPSVSRGMPRPAALGSLIRHTQQLLSGPARDAFSQLAGLLEGESTVTDPAVRAQIQSAAMHDGIMMQELGALLLELGRTTLTLRMGQSHDESVVNAGPAVYISSSGPNPIMVQPLPFQHGGSFGPSHTGSFHPTLGITGGIVGTGEVSRNINIHIHSGSSLVPGGGSVSPTTNASQVNQISAPQSSGIADQVGNVTVASRETGSVRVVPVRTVVAAVPIRPPTEATNATNNVFHPILTNIQQFNSAQGVPIRGVAHATIEVQSSGIDGAQQQSTGTVNFNQAQASSILAQLEAQAQNLHGTIQTVNFHPQNIDGGIQTRNSSSVTSMSSAPNTPVSVQCDTQNQSDSTTDLELMQQRSSSENSVTDIDGRDRVRNDTNSNVSVVGSGEMENMVNAVLQQMMGSYGRSGRANQQQSNQQQTTANPSSRNESTPMTDEPKSPGKLLDDKKDIAQSEKTTINVGSGLSSSDNDMQGRDLASISGNADASTSGTSSQNEMVQPKSDKVSSNAHTAIPVGLGLGGLQPLPSKKRAKQNHKLPANKLAGPDRGGDSDTELSGDKDSQSSIAMGQNVLQALVSEGVSSDRRKQENGSPAQLPSGLAQMFGSMASGGRTGSGRVDVGDIMSQLLRTPTVNNFLRGVAEQTGTVPPGELSNMMEQVTRSPALRNTMQQMTEQLGEHSQELENAFSGMGGRQGGIDFSRMLQQMMPVVSQVLGMSSGGITSGPGPEAQSRTSNLDDHEADKNSQINLEPTVQKLENHDPPQEVFRSMVENAMALYTATDGPHTGVNTSDVSHQLSDTEDLANEYLAMLNRDLITRLQSDSGLADNS